MTSEGYSAPLAVPADHPALAGHFPGAPVAPGVYVLDLVLSIAESWVGRRLAVRRMSQVKFHAPLTPGVQATAHLRLDGERLGFKVEHEGRLLVDGSLTLRAQRL